jgi:hypothetical protein
MRPDEMPARFDFLDLKYVVGSAETVRGMEAVRPLTPFSDEALDFLNDLSKRLLSEGRAYSDVATFGFWCRRAALLKEKGKYDDLALRFGRGVAFHNAPSNVPVNFAFSFAAGLLAGNANIVRLPAKDFQQVEIICDAVRELLETEHKNLSPYAVMVKYRTNREISDAFSSLCDTRVVWGGDGTVRELRCSPLKPRANEITFADRYSIAVIDADEYVKAEDKGKIARDFYNDTYFSDQEACTAPRVVCWLGGGIDEAKQVFWSLLNDLVQEKYALAPVRAVGKLAAFYRVACEKDVALVAGEDETITRVRVETLEDDLLKFKYGGGFFFEYDARSLRDIAPVCGERCQTLTHFGLDERRIHDFLTDCAPRGLDRAVPMGKSMDFSLVWDGHDLIREMSRRITVG